MFVKTQKSQLIIIIALSCFIFILICNIASQFPLSPLYQINLENFFREDNERSAVASIYFENLALKNWMYPSQLNEERNTSTHKKEFCIGILTANRTKRYSIQLMHSLMMHMSRDDMKETYIVITHGGSNLTEDSILLSKIFDVRHSNVNYTLNFRVKMALDYADLLEICQHRAKYTLILEDDTISAKNFLMKLRFYLKEIEKVEDLAFVRLFRSEKWYGYNESDIKYFILYGICSASIAHRITNWKLNRISRGTHIILVLYFTLLLVAIPLIIGKQYIFPPFKRGFEIFYAKDILNAKGIHPHQGRCCSQANVYRNGETVNQLIEYMRENAGKSFYDYLLDKVIKFRIRFLPKQFAKNYEKKIYLVVPNLFQHIGIISSYDKKSTKNLHMSWSFE